MKKPRTLKWTKQDQQAMIKAGLRKKDLKWFVCDRVTSKGIEHPHRYRSEARLNGWCRICRSVGMLEGYVP